MFLTLLLLLCQVSAPSEPIQGPLDWVSEIRNLDKAGERRLGDVRAEIRDAATKISDRFRADAEAIEGRILNRIYERLKNIILALIVLVALLAVLAVAIFTLVGYVWLKIKRIPANLLS